MFTSDQMTPYQFNRVTAIIWGILISRKQRSSPPQFEFPACSASRSCGVLRAPLPCRETLGISFGDMHLPEQERLAPRGRDSAAPTEHSGNGAGAVEIAARARLGTSCCSTGTVGATMAFGGSLNRATYVFGASTMSGAGTRAVLEAHVLLLPTNP